MQIVHLQFYFEIIALFINIAIIWMFPGFKSIETHSNILMKEKHWINLSLNLI